jgi:hypothetical protein
MGVKTTCFAKYVCEWTLTSDYGEVEVPYTIIAQTKENQEDKCEEKGNLIIKAFYGGIPRTVSSNYELFSNTCMYLSF